MAKFYNYRCPLCGVTISELQSRRKFNLFLRTSFLYSHFCPKHEYGEDVKYEFISESDTDLKRSDIVIINDNNGNIYRIYRFELSTWEKYIPEKGLFEDVGTTNDEIVAIIKEMDEEE